MSDQKLPHGAGAVMGGAAAGAATGALVGAVGGPVGAVAGGAVGGAVGGVIGAGSSALRNKGSWSLEHADQVFETSGNAYEEIETTDIPNVEKLPPVWVPKKVVKEINEKRKAISTTTKPGRVLEDNGDTANMVLSAKQGQWDKVFEILDRKPYIINAIPQERAWSALHQAVFLKNHGAIEKLLSFKTCDVDIKAKRDRRNIGEPGITPYKLAQQHDGSCQHLFENRSIDGTTTTDVTFVSMEKGIDFLTSGIPLYHLASSFLRRDVLSGMKLENAGLLDITKKMYRLLQKDWKYVKCAVKECIYPFDKAVADRLGNAKSFAELKQVLIRIYTLKVVYRQVNAALRRASETEFPVSDDLLLSLYSLFLTSILLHSGDLQKETLTTYRGITLKKDKLELYREGTTFHWMSFTSTSKNRLTARRFSHTGAGEVNVVFVIDNSQKSMWSPRNIRIFSEYKSEEEVLHPPCARFCVVRVTERPEYTEVGIKLLNPNK